MSICCKRCDSINAPSFIHSSGFMNRSSSGYVCVSVSKRLDKNRPPHENPRCANVFRRRSSKSGSISSLYLRMAFPSLVERSQTYRAAIARVTLLEHSTTQDGQICRRPSKHRTTPCTYAQTYSSGMSRRPASASPASLSCAQSSRRSQARYRCCVRRTGRTS